MVSLILKDVTNSLSEAESFLTLAATLKVLARTPSKVISCLSKELVWCILILQKPLRSQIGSEIHYSHLKFTS